MSQLSHTRTGGTQKKKSPALRKHITIHPIIIATPRNQHQNDRHIPAHPTVQKPLPPQPRTQFNERRHVAVEPHHKKKKKKKKNDPQKTNRHTTNTHSHTTKLAPK
jgi:hypothetical protein